MPKDQEKYGSARQRPISCKFCRTRKLRCSRESPCSNCISRGLQCDLPKLSVAGGASEAELLDRLKKLETLLLKKQGQQHDVEVSPEAESQNYEQSASGATCPNAHQLEGLAHDVAWLENMYIVQGVQGKIPTCNVVFKICPIQQITPLLPIVYQPEIPQNVLNSPSRCIWLPQLEEAQILLQKYLRDVDHIHHTTHSPSLPGMLNEAYASLQQSGQIKSGPAILLLAIFSSATHCWVPADCERGLFATATEANDQSVLWAKATLDVVDAVYRSPSLVSLEGCQGIVMMAFVIGSTEGFSRRCRALFAIALFIARELGLHRIDHPANAANANTIQAEIGRRVWWYLAATDWTIAYRFSPNWDGIYNCHPRQMMTKKPLNINDDDLFDGMSRDERPLSEPTAMSYFLQRLKLAEICRNMIDRSILSMSHSAEPSHNDIIDCDTELQLIENEIQPFWCLNEAQLMEKYNMTADQADRTRSQGHSVYFFIYTTRLKWHLPYFTRALTEPAYSASREICLSYASKIIQLQTYMEHARFRTTTRYYFTFLLLGVFMSSIVLFMELCRDRPSPNREKQREEVAEAFRLLDDSKEESEMATQFVSTLMHILQKHKLPPPKPSNRNTPQARSPDPVEQYRPTPITGNITPSHSFVGQCNAVGVLSIPSSSSIADTAGSTMDFSTDEAMSGNLASCFGEFTQNFQNGGDLGSLDWNDFFSELNLPSFI